MNFDDFKEVLPGLINICMETGKYQMKYHRKSLEIKVKANKTLVTEIDIHSSNMIKNKLNQWLRNNSIVWGFCSARPSDGGTGAIYVYLKSN